MKILGLLMIFGGLVRLFADEHLFGLAGILTLWSDHGYFIYIYRILGSFVMLSGVTLFIFSGDIERYSPLIIAWAVIFTLIGSIMIWAGISNSLSFIFFLPDFLFSFLTALILFLVAYRK